MRLNKFIALHSHYSRRAADTLIAAGKISVNGKPAEAGQDVNDTDIILIEGKPLSTDDLELTTITFHKPSGYVCSRNGQGSKTIYELLPAELQHLNSVGRLDKNSSGLLVMTNDGELANQLTHPRYHKTKVYEVTLDKPLEPLHQQMISDFGIQLEDGSSKFIIEKLNPHELRVTMHEGRNRQIRRTFGALGYEVVRLHRISFGNYTLGTLEPGDFSRHQS